MRKTSLILGLVLGFVLSWNAFCAAEKVVVIPLLGDERPVCTGTMHGTRWCDQGDGTVLDMTTGLVWLKKADWGGLKPWGGYLTFDDAHIRAGILQHGTSGADLSDGSTVGDWRLPTKNELYGLANGTEAVRWDTPRAFTGVQNGDYWSSTTRSVDTPWQAWVVSLSDGSAASVGKGIDYYVWPVRGGQ